MNSISFVIFPLKLNCYFCSATSCKVSTMEMEDGIVLQNKADQNILDGYLIKTIHHFAMYLIQKLN